jgi:hypothetical protein
VDTFFPTSVDVDSGLLSDDALGYLEKLGKGALDALPFGTNDGVISGNEVQWAGSQVVSPLNQAVRQGAEQQKWTFVDGTAAAYAGHGYCARNHWVVRYEESKGSQVDLEGTMHPNIDGHTASAVLLIPRVAADLGVTLTEEGHQ